MKLVIALAVSAGAGVVLLMAYLTPDLSAGARATVAIIVLSATIVAVVCAVAAVLSMMQPAKILMWDGDGFVDVNRQRTK